ncbi:MAG: hypothetical protein O3B97_04375 [Actinomycetota bacterium]|nr:hypothetical protein [Actinomycetota bacterium]
MKLYPFAIASAAVLGTAAVLVGSGTAANENANTTGQQLLINQRISQAAVRRSNSALNYLAPVRTTQSDAANTGRNGVTPLSRVTGSGKGWTTAQIAHPLGQGGQRGDRVGAVVIPGAGSGGQRPSHPHHEGGGGAVGHVARPWHGEAHRSVRVRGGQPEQRAQR